MRPGVDALIDIEGLATAITSSRKERRLARAAASLERMAAAREAARAEAARRDPLDRPYSLL
jgi:hypothetical protein